MDGLMSMYDYKDHKLVVRSTHPVKVQVFLDKKKPALFETTSLDLAMKWVDAKETS